MRRIVSVLFIGMLTACEPEPRVPYLPARLEAWPQPYRGVTGLKLWAINTGTLEVPEALLFRGGSFVSRRTIDNVFYLLHHPRDGWILFDTGFDDELEDGAAAHVGPFVELLCRPRAHGDLRQALAGIGVEADEISQVVLSDLHFDRSGSLDLLAAARVVVSAAERERAEDGGFGYLAQQWADVETWKLIEFPAVAPLGTFPTHIDLLGDGSVHLIPTPGHSAGGISALIMASKRPIFLAGDLVPVAETLRFASRPALLDDAAAWTESLWRLKKLQQLVPDTLVLPAHDLAPARAAAASDLIVIESEPPPLPTPTPASEPWMPRPL